MTCGFSKLFSKYYWFLHKTLSCLLTSLKCSCVACKEWGALYLEEMRPDLSNEHDFRKGCTNVSIHIMFENITRYKSKNNNFKSIPWFDHYKRHTIIEKDVKRGTHPGRHGHNGREQGVCTWRGAASALHARGRTSTDWLARGMWVEKNHPPWHPTLPWSPKSSIPSSSLASSHISGVNRRIHHHSRISYYQYYSDAPLQCMRIYFTPARS